MRPPGRLEKESERALLKTASKRTEQYVNEKHSGSDEQSDER